ncbi:MAG: zinc ABC transporter substrate-binding protein [Solirubrobacteraceae bacterium]
MIGVSQAGFWVPRALASEHRLAAGVADGGAVDVSRSWLAPLPKELCQLLDAGEKDAFDEQMHKVEQVSPAGTATLEFRGDRTGSQAVPATSSSRPSPPTRRGEEVENITTPMLVLNPQTNVSVQGNNKTQSYDSLPHMPKSRHLPRGSRSTRPASSSTRPASSDSRVQSQFALTCLLLAASAVLALAVAGCGSQRPTAAAGSGKLQVVAAENFWGSIAAQLGGEKVQVQSIIVNPATDPHSYEPTGQDARTMAGAQMAIVNGIGYDEWAPKLLNASPASGRLVLSVGDTLGLKEGDNPHQWYSPSNVHAIVNEMVADYDRLKPQDTSYFAQQKRTFETVSLARYDQLRAEIRSKYAGVPVGYSESIFQPLGEDLGLKLDTPYSFAKAIAEGTEVTAQDKLTVDSQAQNHQIKVWVFNSQNVTPDVQRVNEIARAQHIPIATVTETLSPASDTFQQWQVAELEGLKHALAQATGK